MGLIELDKIEPGMVLAKPVYSHLGALLLKEGKTLTEKELLILESWKIKEIDIEGVESSENKDQMFSGQLGKDEIDKIEAEIDAKFSSVPQDNMEHPDMAVKVMMEIKKIVKTIKVESLLEEKKHGIR
ncbi:MAG: hypothetical protein PHX21_02025 [bacterium]|nr:hypothetical protein [bacterium]